MLSVVILSVAAAPLGRVGWQKKILTDFDVSVGRLLGLHDRRAAAPLLPHLGRLLLAIVVKLSFQRRHPQNKLEQTHVLLLGRSQRERSHHVELCLYCYRVWSSIHKPRD
jgi:hypothetical protein